MIKLEDDFAFILNAWSTDLNFTIKRALDAFSVTGVRRRVSILALMHKSKCFIWLNFFSLLTGLFVGERMFTMLPSIQQWIGRRFCTNYFLVWDFFICKSSVCKKISREYLVLTHWRAIFHNQPPSLFTKHVSNTVSHALDMNFCSDILVASQLKKNLNSISIVRFFSFQFALCDCT